MVPVVQEGQREGQAYCRNLAPPGVTRHLPEITRRPHGIARRKVLKISKIPIKRPGIRCFRIFSL